MNIHVQVHTHDIESNKAIVFSFFFYRFFPNKLGSEDEIKNKNKIHLDHFPIELKSKKT